MSKYQFDPKESNSDIQNLSRQQEQLLEQEENLYHQQREQLLAQSQNMMFQFNQLNFVELQQSNLQKDQNEIQDSIALIQSENQQVNQQYNGRKQQEQNYKSNLLQMQNIKIYSPFKSFSSEENVKQLNQIKSWRILLGKVDLLFYFIFSAILIIIALNLNAWKAGIFMIVVILVATYLKNLLKSSKINQEIKKGLQSFQLVQQVYCNLIQRSKFNYQQKPQFVRQVYEIFQQFLIQYYWSWILIENIKQLNDQKQINLIEKKNHQKKVDLISIAQNQQQMYIRSKLKLQIQNAKNQNQNNSQLKNSHVLFLLKKHFGLFTQIKNQSLKTLHYLKNLNVKKCVFIAKILKNMLKNIKLLKFLNNVKILNSNFKTKIQTLIKVNFKKERIYDRNSNEFLIKLSQSKEQNLYIESLIHFNILIHIFKQQKKLLDSQLHEKQNLEVVQRQLISLKKTQFQRLSHKISKIKTNKIEVFANFLEFLEEQINIKKFNLTYKQNIKNRNKKQNIQQNQNLGKQKQTINEKNQKNFQNNQKSKRQNECLHLINDQITYQILNCNIDKNHLNLIVQNLNKRLQNKTQKDHPQYNNKRNFIQHFEKTKINEQKQTEGSNNTLQQYLLKKGSNFEINLNAQFKNQFKLIENKILKSEQFLLN